MWPGHEIRTSSFKNNAPPGCTRDVAGMCTGAWSCSLRAVLSRDQILAIRVRAEAMSLQVKEELLSRMSSVDSRTGGSLVARDVQAGCSQDTVLETSQPLLLEPVAVAPEVSLGSYVYIPKP